MKAVFSVLGIVVLAGLAAAAGLPRGGEAARPLVLQEMAWVDVQEYLQINDMVIIPLGSTEQHGPHLPLGTDYFEAVGAAKLISARTGVLVAPVVMAGYSIYHSGFPGTLSLNPETFEQVLFETSQILMKYGFRRFLFFNFHGGNSVSEAKVIHRINQSTEAIAVAIGIGSRVQPQERELAPFDQHAGIGETSAMLFLHPELVNMERAEKPVMTFSPRYQELTKLAQKDPALGAVLGAMLAVPEETKKMGSSRDISNNGVWTMGDPKRSTADIGKREIGRMVEAATKFINAWKKSRT